jgi:uncharacterized protein
MPLNLEHAIQYVRNRLERELSPKLTYHAAAHTIHEVVPLAEKLAISEGMSGETFSLLSTAAWFHDLGYVEQPTYHELISARIALEVLPKFGYTDKQVETVRWAIMATALPQSPESLIGEIVADADLGVLGQENFFTRNADLRRELSNLGKDSTDADWYRGQIKFMEDHNYFTKSAHTMLDETKSRNIGLLKDALQKASQ